VLSIKNNSSIFKAVRAEFFNTGHDFFDKFAFVLSPNSRLDRRQKKHVDMPDAELVFFSRAKNHLRPHSDPKSRTLCLGNESSGAAY